MGLGARAAIFIIVFLALMLQPSAGSVSSCINTVALPSSVFSLVGYSLLGLIISIDVVAIGYIIGRIVPSTGVRNWIGEEFMEIAKTAILIAGIFAVLTFMSNVAVILSLPSTSPTNIAGNVEGLAGSACNYLNTITDSSAGLPTTLDYMLSLAGTVGALQGLTVGALLPIPIPPYGLGLPVLWFEFGFSYTPYVDHMFESQLTTGAQESTINDMFQLLIFPVGFLLLAQQEILPSLVALGFAVLIPMGIAFRAFPFIRGIGGTLIAIGIGVSIIYPAVLVLVNGPVTNALSFGSYTSGSSFNCGSNPGLCFVADFATFASSLKAATAAQTAGTGDGLSAFSPFSIYGPINGMLFYAFYLLLQFLLFITDIAIAYPLTDSIARALGGTIRLQIGGKFKLV